MVKRNCCFSKKEYMLISQLKASF